MFDWLFKRKNDDFKDLMRSLKNININIKVTGTLNVKQERGNSLAEEPAREYEVNTADPIKQNQEGMRTEKTFDSIPNFKKLSKPEVEFGKEREV